MAQKTGNEETEVKVVAETICLCVKCGVAGNFAANNLCQKCFTATTAASTSSAVAPPASSTASGADPVFEEKSFRSSTSARSSPERMTDSAQARRNPREVAAASVPMKREVNRCFGCRRRVGLTGFRCRCGELFCAEHRYTDRHDCSYDYKSAGREAIARANPVVKAAKILKI